MLLGLLAMGILGKTKPPRAPEKVPGEVEGESAVMGVGGKPEGVGAGPILSDVAAGWIAPVPHPAASDTPPARRYPKYAVVQRPPSRAASLTSMSPADTKVASQCLSSSAASYGDTAPGNEVPAERWGLRSPV